MLSLMETTNPCFLSAFESVSGCEQLFSLLSRTAKVLRFRRLQHGQGQDEEQAASCGGPRQKPGDWRPHSHAAGPAPEEVLLGDKQASRLASTIREAPSSPPPWGSRQTSLLPPHPRPQYVLPSLPFSSPGTTGFNMSGRVVSVKTPFACMWVGRGGGGWRFRRPVRSQPSLLSHHAQLCPHLRTLLYRLPHVFLVFGVPRCITVGVCHQAGVGWVELMHFVVCRVCFVLFCILKDTKIMCVRELGTMIQAHSLISFFFFFLFAGGWLQREGLEDICE